MTSESSPTIELVPYDLNWPAEFDLARARVVAVLPTAEIHHVGSTSVPGLISKPTIDVLVGLEGSMPSRQAIDALESAGFEFRPASFSDSGERHLFFRDQAQRHRQHHVHVVDAGSQLATDYLAFREYLRAHPTEVATYGAAKLRLLRDSNGNRAWYVDNKIPVVEAMMADARRWYSASLAD